jgi:hypothetical protein
MSKKLGVDEAVSLIETLTEVHKGDYEVLHLKVDAVIERFLVDNGFSAIADAVDLADTKCGGFMYG